MSSRKENLKKSLGITEYPWSSDDDDNMPQVNETMHSSRREPRTSVDDMPGTSATSTQPSSEETQPVITRKEQAKRDRDFYWSIINNTPTPTYINTPRPRTEMPMAESTANRSLNGINVRHIVEFKNLTRSLQNLEHTLSSTNSHQRTNQSSSSSGLQGTSIIPAVNGPSHSRSSAQAGQTAHSSRNLVSTRRPSHSSPRNITREEAASNTVPSRSSSLRIHPSRRIVLSIPPRSSRRTASTHNLNNTFYSPTSPTAAGSSWRVDVSHSPSRSSESASSTSLSTLSSTRSTGPRIRIRPRTQEVPPPSFYHNQENCSRPQCRRMLPVPPSARRLTNAVDYRFESNPEVPASQEIPSTSQNNSSIEIEDFQADSQQLIEPVVPKAEHGDQNHDTPEEVNEEVDLSTHNESGSGARLIEEVVEVAPPDEIPNLTESPNDGDEDLQRSSSENSSSVAVANEQINAAAEEAAPAFQGVKRKRDSNEDRRRSWEPASAQDFNQSLLRLLECPVCLEWIEPPIAQCRRGHLVCGRCRERLSACPVCRMLFSSVRNRAMEGVAELVRYPCRHGCGSEVRLRRRVPHEASCAARRYVCPAPACAPSAPLHRDELAHHFQCKHLSILKIGNKHKFSIKVNAEQHDTWLIMALDEYFHMRVDVDIRAWGVVVYVAYIGPKKNADHFYYEVTVQGQHNLRKLVYTRFTHSDLENSSVNVSRQDCFHLTLDQALNFLRIDNKYCEPDKFLDFDVEISKSEDINESREDSD